MIRVLLADDDRDDAEIFSEALTVACASTSVERFENGKLLLDFLERNDSPTPHIIFLDLNMPVMNGWQCLAALKLNEKFRSIPVVMYTTSSNPRDKQIALDLGAHGLIVKPSRAKLLERILSGIVCKLGTTDLKQAVNDAYLLSRSQ